MHVALNLLFLNPRAGGVGTAARAVVPELLRADPSLRLTIFAGSEADPIRDAADWASEVTWLRHDVTVTHGPPLSLVRHLAIQWLAQPWRARRMGADVLHGLANMGAVVAPGVATVTTFHDLIWKAHPGSIAPRDHLAMTAITPPAAHGADLVLSDSAAARDVLVERLRLDPERIAVVPLGVTQEVASSWTDAATLRDRFALGDGPLLLCVSQKRPHKNLDTLVRAFAALERPDARLLIPGAPTGYEDDLRALASSLGIAERVVLPDWVEAEDLEGLYRTAAGVVLPSLEEGFGLPVLEAMVRGTPVACSNVSALAEVGGDAALQFAPLEPASIAGAMRALLTDEALRARLIVAGHERAATYTWARTAEHTLAAYRRAIELRRTLSWSRA